MRSFHARCWCTGHSGGCKQTNQVKSNKYVHRGVQCTEEGTLTKTKRGPLRRNYVFKSTKKWQQSSGEQLLIAKETM